MLSDDIFRNHYEDVNLFAFDYFKERISFSKAERKDSYSFDICKRGLENILVKVSFILINCMIISILNYLKKQIIF
jgi:hypothetical protein